MSALPRNSLAGSSRLWADLAHELRTPIYNLVGAAQVALSRPRTPPQYVAVLQSALEEYERLRRVIEGMLFLASADLAIATHVHCVPLDVRVQMRAVTDFFQALADERRVTLSCEGGGKVLADRALLRRALSNLVSNAIEYTLRGGRVTLRAEQGPKGALSLRVSDTGVGIAPEHLGKLGETFYRVDPSRSIAHRGEGLGLAIVRAIMNLHGGTLSIESVPAQGTVATLCFPPHRPPVGGGRAGRRNGSAQRDDRSVICSSSAGHEAADILCASTGAAARVHTGWEFQR